MKHFIFLLLIPLVCCNNAVEEVELKNDYGAKNSEALAYCKANNFNENYYFLIDLSVHSGKNRFYVYDFKQQKIVEENLVTHGSCDIPTDYADKWEKARFKNQNNSHCSSLGKYKIGKRDYSSWGINVKYWLHGLEKTNDKAVERVVVLHSWTAVSDTEIFPKYSPVSWGCPAVSDAFMQKLDARLQLSIKPVLLWIIE